jgi:hypothetical protein
MIDPTMINKIFGVRTSSAINLNNLSNNEIINLDNKTEDEKMTALHNDINNIRYISNPTDRMCKYVIRRDPSLFKFCKSHKASLCNEAVEKDPNNLEFAYSVSQEIIMNALRKDGMLLKHVRTYFRVHETAVAQNGLALQFVDIAGRKHKLCVDAVLQNEAALQYVPPEVRKSDKFKLAMLSKYLYFWRKLDHTLKNHIEAVKVNPAIVLMFDNLSSDLLRKLILANYKIAAYIDLDQDMRKLVLEQSEDAIKYIGNTTSDEIDFAISKFPCCIRFMKFNLNLAQLAVARDGTTLRYIEKGKQTQAIVDAAVAENPASVEYANSKFLNEPMMISVANRYPSVIKILSSLVWNECEKSFAKICKAALAQDGMMLQYIHDPSEELQKIAITKNPEAIDFVQEPSLEIQLIAINKKPKILEKIHGQSIEACKRAVTLNSSCLRFISREVWEDLIYLDKYDK